MSLEEDIFRSAELLLESTYILGENIKENKNFSLMVPQVVNGALALELYLKCLSVIENGKLKRIHKIKDLYNSLTVESQKYIKDRFNEITGTTNFPEFNIDLLFNTSLNHANNAFVEFRYSFDYTIAGNTGIDALIYSVRDRIVDLKTNKEKRAK